jgi:hypothetical protein
MSQLSALDLILRALGYGSSGIVKTQPTPQVEMFEQRQIAELERRSRLAKAAKKKAAKKKPAKKRAPARFHWFRCHRCSQNVRRRVSSAPKRKCAICRDDAMVYDYIGYMANPYAVDETVQVEAKKPRQIIMENIESPKETLP